MAEADILIALAITVSRMSDKDVQAGYEPTRAALLRILQPLGPRGGLLERHPRGRIVADF